jgi:lycopene cyclase domain-containing protein
VSGVLYLVALLVSLGGIAFFLVWDIAAIASGHYRAGQSEAMTGIMLAPELPLEELVFITFLCYLTLVLHGLIGVALRHRRPR